MSGVPKSETLDVSIDLHPECSKARLFMCRLHVSARRIRSPQATVPSCTDPWAETCKQTMVHYASMSIFACCFDASENN